MKQLKPRGVSKVSVVCMRTKKFFRVSSVLETQVCREIPEATFTLLLAAALMRSIMKSNTVVGMPDEGDPLYQLLCRLWISRNALNKAESQFILGEGVSVSKVRL